MHVLLRLLVNAAALWVATQLVSGITYTGDGVALFGVALVFGVLNVVIRPILFFLSIPFLILTLGLFTFVLNAVMLMLTSAASDTLGLGFRVDGFGAARSAVTEAASTLRDKGIIDYRRGVLTIRDPKRLQKFACECFDAVSTSGGNGSAKDI